MAGYFNLIALVFFLGLSILTGCTKFNNHISVPVEEDKKKPRIYNLIAVVKENVLYLNFDVEDDTGIQSVQITIKDAKGINIPHGELISTYSKAEKQKPILYQIENLSNGFNTLIIKAIDKSGNITIEKNMIKNLLPCTNQSTDQNYNVAIINFKKPSGSMIFNGIEGALRNAMSTHSCNYRFNILSDQEKLNDIDKEFGQKNINFRHPAEIVVSGSIEKTTHSKNNFLITIDVNHPKKQIVSLSYDLTINNDFNDSKRVELITKDAANNIYIALASVEGEVKEILTQTPLSCKLRLDESDTKIQGEREILFMAEYGYKALGYIEKITYNTDNTADAIVVITEKYKDLIRCPIQVGDKVLVK